MILKSNCLLTPGIVLKGLAYLNSLTHSKQTRSLSPFVLVACQLPAPFLPSAVLLYTAWEPAHYSSQAPWSAASWLGFASGRPWERLERWRKGEVCLCLVLLALCCRGCPPPPSGSGVSGGAASGPHSCGDCLRAVAATMPLADEQHAQAALPPSLVSKRLLPSWSFSSPLYSSISSQGL